MDMDRSFWFVHEFSTLKILHTIVLMNHQQSTLEQQRALDAQAQDLPRVNDPRKREHFIPLRIGELIALLRADTDLSEEERALFDRFCRLVLAVYHCQSHELLERLKSSYAPFDPDADTRALNSLSAAERQEKFNEFIQAVSAVLVRANYKYLNRQDLDAALDGASYWGIETQVDFRAFERLTIFARGDGVEKRPLRRWRKRWRLEEIEVPVYQRLVMIMKLRPQRGLGRQADPEKVYLQLFKDIPELDIDMLLPGARPRMTKLDRGKIGLPLLTGLALMCWQIVRDVAGALVQFIHDVVLFKPAALWAVASGAFAYGFKSYYGYRQTKQRYILSLTQLLYYQNLDTNAGVLYRLLDEAQEQECREALLAYFYLWRFAEENGWTPDELKQFAERDLAHRADLQVQFEHDDSLAKLEQLRVVKKAGDRFRVLPPAQAVERLEESWQEHFRGSRCGLP